MSLTEMNANAWLQLAIDITGYITVRNLMKMYSNESQKDYAYSDSSFM